MDESTLRRILEDVAGGATSTAAALEAVRTLPFADLGFARVDHHRELRQGFPEAVYSPGKTPEHCAAIVAELLAGPTGGPVLLTRSDPDLAGFLLERVPGGEYHAGARLVVWRPSSRRTGEAVVACAGTADLPVAEEAAATLTALGWPPTRLTDVGVAGLHRLLADEPARRAADVVVVVAGMEGALASLVGGITPAPVIAIPTSTGYGAALEGVTALLAMLSSCAAGLTVVGIDNGFGAACAVLRILPGP